MNLYTMVKGSMAITTPKFGGFFGYGGKFILNDGAPPTFATRSIYVIFIYLHLIYVVSLPIKQIKQTGVPIILVKNGILMNIT